MNANAEAENHLSPINIDGMVALVPPPNRPWPSSRSTPARSGSEGMPYIAPPLLLASLGRSHAAMLWPMRAVT